MSIYGNNKINFRIKNDNEIQLIEEESFPISFKDYGECEIIIRGRERSKPHFHIQTRDKKINCCVKLNKNEFFDHSEYNKFLNSKQQEELDKWLKKPNKKNKNLSNWEYLVNKWNQYNPNYKIDASIDQPDYTEIIKEKDRD